MATGEDVQFGKAALSLGMITQTQLATCLTAQKEAERAGKHIALSEILLEHSYLNASQLTTIYAHSQVPCGKLKTPIGVPTLPQDMPLAMSHSFVQDITPVPTQEKSQDTTKVPEDTQGFPPAALSHSFVQNIIPQQDKIKRSETLPGSEKSRIGSEKTRNFGRYQIISELGRGGMGCVYKAYDPDLERIVAIKMMLSGESARQEDSERFLREARATAKFDHPNIVKIYDIGSQAGQSFFTMEFVEGSSLKSLAKKSPPSICQITEIMVKVGDAVHYAHRQGIIHRDLKPANVMMTQKGDPKVMDFGLAKMVKETGKLSQSGMVMGTLHYMPPEQAEGRLSAIDARSDVYALGTMFYELLTGFVPFTGDSSFQIIYQILNKEPIPPSQYKRYIPKDIESICLKALEKDKNHRYQSAAELVDDLLRFSKGEPVWARPIGIMRKLGRKAKRHRRVLIGMGIVCFIVTTIMWSWYAHKIQEKVQEARKKAQQGQYQNARDLQEGKKYEAAFDIYEQLLNEKELGEDFSRKIIDQVVANAKLWASKAIVHSEWETVNDILKRIESLRDASTGKRYAQLEELRKKIEDCEVGEGKFCLAVGQDETGKDDVRAGYPFFLVDLLTLKMKRVALGKTYSLLPREYILFHLGEVGPSFLKTNPEKVAKVHEHRGKKYYYDHFFFTMEPQERLEFQLKTIRIEDAQTLNKALEEAKGGWEIQLEPGEYAANIVLGKSHSHLRLVGLTGPSGERPVLYDQMESPLVIDDAHDVQIDNLALVSAQIDNLALVSASTIVVRNSQWIALDFLTVGGGCRYGISVEDSKGVDIKNIRFASVGKFGYRTPWSGIYYRNNIGGAILSNEISQYSRNGIEIQSCQNLYVAGNKILSPLPRGGECGIRLVDTITTKIVRNRCNNHRRYGILLDGSCDSDVLWRNVCRNNLYTGITISSSGKHFMLLGNIIERNQMAGIEIFCLSATRFALERNVITNNGVGVQIERKRNVKLFRNYITSNVTGIKLDILDDSKDEWPKDGVGWNRKEPIVESDENIFWQNTDIGELSGRSKKTLNEWQEATKTDAKSVQEDIVYRRDREDEIILPDSAVNVESNPIWPISCEIVFAGYPPQDSEEWYDADTLHFEPRSEKDTIWSKYEKVDGKWILSMPLARFPMAVGKAPVGIVKDNLLVVDSSRDIESGTITTTFVPFYGFDSIQEKKCYVEAECPVGADEEKTVAFRYSGGVQDRMLSPKGQYITVGDLKKNGGIYRHGFACTPMNCNCWIRLEWLSEEEVKKWSSEEKKEPYRRASKVSLKFIEIKVYSIDLAYRISEEHKARWAGTKIETESGKTEEWNRENEFQNKIVQVKPEEKFRIVVKMRNIGKSIWLCAEEQNVYLDCISHDCFRACFQDWEKEMGIAEIVSPLKIGTFSSPWLTAPKKAGSYLLIWQPAINHPTVRGLRRFGDKESFILNVVADAEHRD